ncbi:CoA transferase [Rubrobacter marinus]|uniref:CoA transferase n=1 Tax=Rubrobacter marinus TaxID=2653852 RepID=A0A6G8PVE0_9ACTN|nr:CaiB/BaiF CoA-transferase family protein [Rubrobacter marinus]QIN78166.1 CoA transferase [Rubrobacter marinus]
MTDAEALTGLREQLEQDRPLEGLRVLEFGSLIAGPFATRIMAEFGAEVIKAERPGTGDPLRNWRYVDPGTKTSLWWALQSRNKKLVTLDLGHPEGLELAKKLAAGSDVLLENFRPGTLEKLGLGPEALRGINPRLILVRVSGYGQTGPYKDKPGFANIGEAMGGIRYVTGEPGRPPVRTGVSLGDSLASLYAVIGTLMAVHARDVRGTGEGQVVDVALYEAVFNLMESLVPEYDVAGIVRERTGASLPGIAPSSSYCAGDGSYVAIGANSDAIFKRLMKAIGRPELADDPRYATNADRAEHADEIDDLIEGWTGRHGAEEIQRILDEAAVPAGPIYSVTDILEDEQYRAREMIVEGEVEGVGAVKMPGLVPKLSKTPGRSEWYGGKLGAHNEEVYGGLLGLSPEEIERLSEEGAI